MNPPVDQIIHGDCLEVMREWPDECVDCVVTDPPFSLTLTNHTKRTPAFDRLRIHEWDNEFMWVKEMARVLVDGGGWYICSNDEGLGLLKQEAIDCGLRPCNRLVWIKTNPLPSYEKCNYRNSTELAVYGTKGNHTRYFAERTQQELHSHWFGPIVGGKQRTAHPTQKPVKLMERWIGNSCPPQGIVLDPFLGSGTTAVAALNLCRHFIGIEKEAEYVEIARNRLAALTQAEIESVTDL